MATLHRTSRIIALAAMSSLLLAACGDDGGSGASGGSGGDASEAPAAEATFEAEPCTDTNLCIGTLLPETGSLSSLGPPEFAGVQLAVTEINEAGGVLDMPVGYLQGDSGDTSQDIANPTVDRLLAGNADVIVGAASSSVSFNVIDKIVNAGKVMYSPANTSPDFTTYDDKGLYFRTAPSDVLQGRVLGETVIADGNTSVGIISLQDPYGEGLATNISSAVTAGGGSLAPAAPIFYDPNATNFDAQVGQIASANPDAIVVIGFAESAQVVQALEAQGIGQSAKQLYFVDGNVGSAELAALPAGTLEGAKGTQPGSETPGDFQSRAQEVYGDLGGTFNYLGESYDAVVTSALAALVAGSIDGPALAAALPDVTRGGEKCDSFSSCKELIDGGTTDIDYDGVSGPIEFSDAGDPTEATVGVYTFTADNTLDEEIEFVAGKLD